MKNTKSARLIKSRQPVEYETLKQMRDELALKSHLFSLEVKQDWAKLEKKWQQVQSDLKPVEPSIIQLRTSLTDAYQQLRKHLKSA